MGRFDWFFEYREDDHDEGEKSFLGHKDNLNGLEVIQIICDQPATLRFLARHLYNYFVADDAQVPAWSVTPPRDPKAIEILVEAMADSDLDIRQVLRLSLIHI